MAVEQLEIVRENPDGSLQWRERLVAPGAPGTQSAVLANIDLATLFGATEFEITPAGDWLATVAGMKYNVRPAIHPKTGEFCFVGIPIRPNRRPGDTRRINPKFSSVGSLTCLLSGNPDDMRAYFSSSGNLTAKLTTVRRDRRRGWFRSEGTLTAEVRRKIGDQRTRAVRFRSAGRLRATVVERVPSQVDALFDGNGILLARAVAWPDLDLIKWPQFAGEGSLTATAFDRTRQPVLLSHFDFEEGSGPAASSTPPGYTLTAPDPAGAWTAGAAAGEFIGVVGSGPRDAWRVSMTLTITEADPATGVYRYVEMGKDDAVGTVAFGFYFTGSQPYAGLRDNVTSQWTVGTRVLPTNTAMEVVYESDPVADTITLWVDGQVEATLPHAVVRDFDADATLLYLLTADDNFAANVSVLEYHGYSDVVRKAKT